VVGVGGGTEKRGDAAARGKKEEITEGGGKGVRGGVGNRENT